MNDSTTPLTQNPDGLCMCGCGQPTKLWDKSEADRGRVKGQHQRYIRGHNSRLCSDEYSVADNGCWIWQRGRNSSGYGVCKRGGRMVLAHRVYYEHNIGVIPEGLQLDHICRNRACVNPAHLEPVTPAENSRRGSRSKLSAADAHTIRCRVSSGEPHRSIAADFGISEQTVGNVKHGRSWAIRGEEPMPHDKGCRCDPKKDHTRPTNMLTCRTCPIKDECDSSDEDCRRAAEILAAQYPLTDDVQKEATDAE